MREIEETISHLKLPALIEKQEEKYAKLMARKQELEAALNTPQPEERAVTVWKLRHDIVRLAYEPWAWYEAPLDHQKRLIRALTTKLDLSLVAPHWMQLEVEWFFPSWGSETVYMLRRLSPPVRWTPEDAAWLSEHYRNASRDEIMYHFSDRNWEAIKNYAHDSLGMKRSYAERERGKFEGEWSCEDWRFIEAHPEVLD